MIRASRGPVRSVVVSGTQHFDFTDYAAYRFLFPLRDLLPLGSRPGAESLVISEKCLLDFTAETNRRRPEYGCLDGHLGGTTTRSWGHDSNSH
ncbi:MAG: hypothetical protein JWR90_3949 [Marmoricola sp.]|jgi:hypothetical protein|nr:hypothetical protein [Marmoricola sp.]